MAEINSEVYDIFQPTPVPLKDLSAIAVSLEIWRCQMMKYHTIDDTFETFDPTSETISSKSILPDLPSVIHATIDKYITKLGFSMGGWLRSHHKRVFYPPYNHQNYILGCFEDFVCDYNGTIHYVRTAERMLHCDQFNVQQKFIIACTYFFEKDIKRLWPLVSSNTDLNSIEFSINPQLYYWICYVKDELDKIPTTLWWEVEEEMLNESMTHNRPSVEYFWNRIDAESRVEKAYDVYVRDVQSFARYILPKLNDRQLDKFVNGNGNGFKMMHAVYKNAWYDNEFILSIWMLIRNIINESVFTNEIIVLLQCENGKIATRLGRDYLQGYEDDKDGSIRRNWFTLCCEIWNTAPEKLKRSAIEEITSDNELCRNLRPTSYSILPKPKEYEFFTTVLSYASYDERKNFWSNCWPALMVATRCEDFKKLMNLCFENEDEITQFKENVMLNRLSFYNVCSDFLICACFDDLNEFMSLLRPETTATKNFKQRLLQSNLLVEHCYFQQVIIEKPREMNEFIDDAYNDAELSRDFKNQLISLPLVVKNLPSSALEVPIETFKEFIDLFVSNEETVMQIKTGIIDFLKEADDLETTVSESSLTALLSWCLENDEEVTEFKMNSLRL